jgi:precorrin-6Y C5,15-methyltransferase (decarboxylating)
MSAWLSVVGIGEDGLSGLTPIARAALDQAEVLVGGTRHLAMLPNDARRRLVWANPLIRTLDEIAALKGKAVCVLATGDPMWFGVGVTLRHRFGLDDMRVIPSPSAFSLAAARLGWPLADVECLTVHGRPLDRIRPFVQPGAKLLVLATDGETPGQAAKLLIEMGYGASRLTALERLSSAQEKTRTATASAWDGLRVADLNTLAIDCVATPDARVLARVPGLPDEVFTHDGQLTKREARAITLAALAPLPGQCLWDVGAGCGSVAIEWLRAARGTTAHAIERDPQRAAMIAENALALGVPELAVVPGHAPEQFANLPQPDAIFIGGGVTDDGMLDAARDALRSGGRLVCNTVTLEAQGALVAAAARYGGELIKLDVAQAAPLGGFRIWRPKLSLVQWRAVKP